jgi:hypothetical protein
MISFDKISSDKISSEDDIMNVSQLLNLTIFLFSLYIYFKVKFNFKKSIVRSFVLITLMLLLNFIFSDYASLKWFINWLGFIFISITIVHIFLQLSIDDIKTLEKRIRRWFLICCISLSIIFSMLYLFNISEFVEYFLEFRFDYLIEILTRNVGLYKQLWGPFIAFVIIYIYYIWYDMSSFEKKTFLFFLLISTPAILSVRTLWLGVIFTTFWIFFTKNILRRFILLSLIITIIYIFYFNWGQIEPILGLLYDRLPSLKFAVGYSSEHYFGLGNGGYHIYVAENNDKIVSKYGSDFMLYSGNFWIAPESDLVYFIASWGILSTIFFYVFIKFILRASNLLHFEAKLEPFEKVLLLMSIMIIFMGISEDFAGKLIWFIFLSFGFAVILRQKHLNNKH